MLQDEDGDMSIFTFHFALIQEKIGFSKQEKSPSLKKRINYAMLGVTSKISTDAYTPRHSKVVLLLMQNYSKSIANRRSKKEFGDFLHIFWFAQPRVCLYRISGSKQLQFKILCRISLGAYIVTLPFILLLYDI